jgi:hypothetical protein
MSKLAHSNQETMDEIERKAREGDVGYESLVLPVDDWKLQIDHNDAGMTVSIINKVGEFRYIRISPAQAQQLKRYLNSALPAAI